MTYFTGENNSLYKKIVDDIIQGIKSGTYNTNEKLPTEMSLAERYGVSRATVSKAMKKLKEDGIIIRYAGRGTFVNNDALSILEGYESENSSIQRHAADMSQMFQDEFKQIVLITPLITDRFILLIILGIQEVLLQSGYHIAVITSYDAAGEAKAIKHIRRTGASALVLFPVDQEYYSHEALSMKLEKFPFVLIDRPFPGIDTNFVLSDSFSGGKIAMKHLVELGHRNIAFVTSVDKSTYTVNGRISGCEKELQSLTENNLFIVEDEFDFNFEYSYYHEFIKELVYKKKVTAFIASEGAVAIYLYCVLESLSINVPDDVSIITFDAPLSDLECFEHFTHINQNPKKMGYYAGQILMNLLNSPSNLDQTTKKIVFPTLVKSKTTSRIK